MHRAVFLVLTILAVLTGSSSAADASASMFDETPGDQPPVRLARPTWDTGWFQAEIYRLALQRLGYRTEDPVTMGVAEFYRAVADGSVDMWASGWFPSHDSYLDDVDVVEVVGRQVDDGALQGYFVDAATAETHGITNLGDLADPVLAALFDHDGDGRADLIGCNVEWSCATTIDHHLQAYALTDTVEHVQGDYSPLIAETLTRQKAGKPVLYYTWTPNWTVGALVPGRDVIWLETPFPSLPEGQALAIDRTAIAGISGCANDPCQVGWPPNDIRVVANSDFLDANPSIRTLLEQVVIPLEDISAQNILMVTRDGDPSDIRRQAEEWMETNLAQVNRWIEAADPNAVKLDDTESADEPKKETFKVAARALAPFVIYENRAYSGFEVELVRLLGAQIGMEAEIYAVDTVAKQVDDIIRGEAKLGLGGTTITESREQIIDFSLPILDSGLTIMTPTKASDGVEDRILVFFRAIGSSDLPWLLMVFAVAVLVSAHLIWLLERRNNPDFAELYRRGIWDSLYWSVVTMSTVGYGDKVARGPMGRVLALVWIALGTLVFASFTASIASSLAVSELRGEISGPSDLPGQRVATVSYSAGETYLPTIGVGPVLVDDLDDAYLLLADDKVDAIVFDAPVLQFHASRLGAGEVTTIGAEFERVQYGLMINERDADLRERLNLALLELMESGVYGRLHDRWFGSYG